MILTSLLVDKAEILVYNVGEERERSGNMAKKKMKKSTKNVLKVIISIVYICWGIYAPIDAFGALLALNVPAMISAAVGILMLLAGIFGLFGMKKDKCRVFGIIICIFSLIGVVAALPAINISSLITALLAWLFIVCIN